MPQTRDRYLPLSVPFIGEEEKAEMLAVLDSGWLSTGPGTKQFEEDLAGYLGAKHAAALSSCTAGLHLALLALNVGPGDEVITSPFTFVSTANVILHAGARPVFADIRRDTYNISPAEVEAKITGKTKAVIPVHYAGQPCDMDEIAALAERHSLGVIHDCATAIGARYKDRLVGSNERDIVVFSFYANKTMTTGEGGALVTGRSDVADTVRLLSLHGMDRNAWKRYSRSGSWFFEVNAPGYKCNMTDMQAALGRCQLRRLKDFIAKREEICRLYDEAFEGLEEITTPVVLPCVRSSRYIYPVLLDCSRLTMDRDRFITQLREMNIGTSVHYIPVHLQPYYMNTFGYKRGDFPVAESVYDRVVSLPLFPQMSSEDAEYVVASVKLLVEKHRS